MKILLVEPAKPQTSIGGDDVFLFEPLALEYLAAGIPDVHEVKILDLRLEHDLLANLIDYQPDIVGITAYTIHVNIVKELSKMTKSWNDKTLTVVGGHHATILPNDFITPHIDLVVRGEGVIPFQEIVKRYQNQQSYTDIPGVFYSQGGKAVHPSELPQIDLDELPFPNRNLTAQYRKEYYSDWMKPLASIRTSKGCPYRCTFCALWKLTGGRYLKREPEKIVEELANIDEEWIFFADDESLLDTNRMARLADLIHEKGITKRYFVYARSDTITNNHKLLEKWKGIGLERVFIGIEFCKDEDLDYIQKKSTMEDNNRAVKILHGLGIEAYASFIIRPEFTKNDFVSLGKYCRNLDLVFASFAVLTPLPGTDLYEEVKDQMIIDNYDYFDFIHTLLPTKIRLKDFYKEYYNLHIKGRSLQNHLRYLLKFPLKDLPKLLVKGQRFYNRLKNTYQDYP